MDGDRSCKAGGVSRRCRRASQFPRHFHHKIKVSVTVNGGADAYVVVVKLFLGDLKGGKQRQRGSSAKSSGTQCWWTDSVPGRVGALSTQ